MYKVEKSLNNNLILATNEQQKEVVLVGKGIGFRKQKGERINEKQIDKIYYAEDQSFSNQLTNISSEILEVTELIIRMGETQLGKNLNTTILVSLADHIQSALERQQQGHVLVENNLQWEIPFLYYQEFLIGQKARQLIEEHLRVELPEIESSFIALHFVTAQDGIESMAETLQISEITKSMIKTIQALFNLSLNKKSVSYTRFITHIRYFMNRQLHHQEIVDSSGDKLYQILQEQYPQSYACGLMIREMLQRDYQIEVSDDEIVYLILHIERVVSETKKIQS